MSADRDRPACLCDGKLHGGGAYVPAMADKSIIVEGQGTIFLAGPPLVKAATGEVISAEELERAQTPWPASRAWWIMSPPMTSRRYCCCARSWARSIPARKAAHIALQPPRPPKFDVQELYGIIPRDVRAPYDVHEVIARMVDGSGIPRIQIAVWRQPESAVSPISGACR